MTAHEPNEWQTYVLNHLPRSINFTVFEMPSRAGKTTLIKMIRAELLERDDTVRIKELGTGQTTENFDGVDVVLVDDRRFTAEQIKLLGVLKKTCRVIVLFTDWRGKGEKLAPLATQWHAVRMNEVGKPEMYQVKL